MSCQTELQWAKPRPTQPSSPNREGCRVVVAVVLKSGGDEYVLIGGIKGHETASRSLLPVIGCWYSSLPLKQNVPGSIPGPATGWCLEPSAKLNAYSWSESAGVVPRRSNYEVAQIQDVIPLVSGSFATHPGSGKSPWSAANQKEFGVRSRVAELNALFKAESGSAP